MSAINQCGICATIFHRSTSLLLTIFKVFAEPKRSICIFHRAEYFIRLLTTFGSEKMRITRERLWSWNTSFGSIVNIWSGLFALKLIPSRTPYFHREHTSTVRYNSEQIMAYDVWFIVAAIKHMDEQWDAAVYSTVSRQFIIYFFARQTSRRVDA